MCRILSQQAGVYRQRRVFITPVMSLLAPRASLDTRGAHITIAERRSARASLSRALSRLEKRMLIDFVGGTWGTYSGGLVLTAHGEQIAKALIAANSSEQPKQQA